MTSRSWTPSSLAELAPQPGPAVLTPRPMRADPVFDEALLLARGTVLRWAGDAGNAWAVGHGIQALGERFKLLDGRNAVQGLFQDYCEEVQVGGRTYLRFPIFKGEIRVEPHTDQLLKIFTDIGLAPGTRVLVQGRLHRVADLWRGSIARSYVVPERNHASYGSTDDIAWSLQGIAAWAPPGFAWTADDGTPMTLDAFTTWATAVLVAETKFLAEAMEHRTSVERRGQGIFHYICGGAHLLQGVAHALGRGFGRPVDRLAFARQVDLWFYRLGLEIEYYDRALKEAPEHALRLTVQRMAFCGHFVESMHKLMAYGIFLADDRQAGLIEEAARQAATCLRRLKEMGVLDHMPALRKQDEQVYLDVVGDSAHALFALELALGRQKIRL